MKAIIAIWALILALSMASQAKDIAFQANYGKTWISNNTDLWSWGGAPKGYSISNGQLIYTPTIIIQNFSPYYYRLGQPRFWPVWQWPEMVRYPLIPRMPLYRPVPQL